MNVFLDTNAIVKLYHQESGTDDLTNFLTLHQGNLIITISDLAKIGLYSTSMPLIQSRQYLKIFFSSNAKFPWPILNFTRSSETPTTQTKIALCPALLYE
ncbi:MAG: hypothetical protein ACREOO_25180 [bacterium]